MENDFIQESHWEIPIGIQVLNVHQPSSQPSSSSSTIISEHNIDDIEIDLSMEYPSLNSSSSFQTQLATYPWSLLHNISSKDESITVRSPQSVVRASVAFSISPSPFLSTLCLSSPKENYYDAVLVFTFSDGAKTMYRVNAATPLIITSVFAYNLSHRHIILTNNEIDTEPLYAHHLHIMNSFKMTNWMREYNPSRLLCGESPQNDGMMKKEIPIYHECEYIAHLINHFIPKEQSMNPKGINSPNILYKYLLKINELLNV